MHLNRVHGRNALFAHWSDSAPISILDHIVNAGFLNGDPVARLCLHEADLLPIVVLLALDLAEDLRLFLQIVTAAVIGPT